MQKKLSEGVTCFLIDGYPRELEQGERFEKEVINNTKMINIIRLQGFEV
jgi:hypothetical protein